MRKFLIPAAGTVAIACAAAHADDVVVDLIVSLNVHAGPTQIAAVQALGGEVRYDYDIIDAMAVRIPADAADALSAIPGVTLIEEDSIGEWLGEDEELNASWAVKQVGAGDAHLLGATGSGVKLAILDSGINENHEDLVDNYVYGWDFEGNDPFPDEPFGHGTYTSGCAAAVKNGIGVVGIAPDAEIYMLKVGSFGPQTSAVIAALDFSVKNGIDVTNSSFSLNQSQAVTDAYNAAYEVGILNIAAAGNTGGNFVTYPATLDTVMAVSATTQNKTLAFFSAYGNDIEVAAPGDNIYTTASNGGYGFNSGTSFSSPYTVGLAGLLYALNPPDLNDDGRINDEVRQIIKDTAEDLGTPGFDIFFGFGLIDAKAAVESVMGDCYPDFDADGALTILDFIAFQNAFTAGNANADCDNNAVLDILDFICFQNSFTAGCP